MYLLLNADVPLSIGFDKIQQNIGSIRNRGLEISLNTVNFAGERGRFKWTTNFNISFNKSKITGLSGDQDFLVSGIQYPTIDNLYIARVVHITSGVSALVLAIVVGKRRDFGILEHRPHNVPFVLLGAGLLWFGWFGFNAGSALAANGLAVHALVTTHVSAAAAMFSWLAIEKHVTGHPSLVGGSTGLVAGLVAITPGAGFVSIWSAILIGLMVSPICFYAISVLKKRFAYDDALDAFGCHGVGGIFGGLATAIFTTPDLALDKANIGLIYGKAHLFIVTILTIIFTAIWSALVTYGIIKVIAHYMPLRVSDRDEAIGLDDCEHKETAYPTFMGLDS